MPTHHLIFEGAELSGKSWLISQIYNFLEPKYNQNGKVLDGCHWFNCDIGVFGTKHGQTIIDSYVDIFKKLTEKNLLIEKFYLSDKIYNLIYHNTEVPYKTIEKTLLALDFKIILTTFPEDIKLLEKRIADRLNLYPHYAKIVKKPQWYIEQQRQYLKEIKKTNLPYLIIEADKLPNENLTKKIIDWVGEK
jgi:hypothetical protein